MILTMADMIAGTSSPSAYVAHAHKNECTVGCIVKIMRDIVNMNIHFYYQAQWMANSY